jgi:hypothetical protein
MELNTYVQAGTSRMNPIMQLSKTAGTNDQVRGITTVAYGGTLVVTNLAGTLAAGDSFKLFDAAHYTGAFAAISPASPGIGIIWDMSYLPADGTLRVTTSTTCVTFEGLQHCALGNAVLIVYSNQLTVVNLGTNGQDGVSIALNGVKGFEAHWNALDPNGDLPVGTYLKREIIGTAPGVTNQMLGTAQVTKAGPSNYVATADFSGLGVFTYTVNVYSGANLVAHVPGLSGNLCSFPSFPTDMEDYYPIWTFWPGGEPIPWPPWPPEDLLQPKLSDSCRPNVHLLI